MPIITIQMRGGVVQNVEGIPPAITIRIQSEGEVKEFTAPPSTLPLPTRNTKLLREIISTVQHLIQYPAIALDHLEQYYQDEFLLNAGDIEFVTTAAEELRLAVTTPECAQALDYIASHGWTAACWPCAQTASAPPPRWGRGW